MIKGSIQKNTTIINIYAHNTGAPQYIRQMLIAINGELTVTIIVVDCNTPLMPMDRSSRQKLKGT